MAPWHSSPDPSGPVLRVQLRLPTSGKPLGRGGFAVVGHRQDSFGRSEWPWVRLGGRLGTTARLMDEVSALVVEWGKPLAGGQGEAAGGVLAADVVVTETGSIEFGILGPLEVSRAGRSVTLGGPRQRAVLALLLLEANRVVSMDRLAEEVWDGHPPDGWVATLQTYVFHLRHALEPDRPRGGNPAVLVT